MAQIFASIGDSVLSLQDIATVKVAILACIDPELKKDILCTPCGLMHKCEEGHAKRVWNEIIGEKARMVLRKFVLPETLREKVISAVYIIGIKMVIWAEYHEGTIGFSREFTLHFLNCSFFTPQGIIDRKKAAEELMKVQSLGIQQKYKIACLYCFKDDIPVLFRQMSRDDMKKHTSVRQPGLVRYWSHYLLGEVDNIKREKTLDQYMLDIAIETGSKASVEYCFEQAFLKRNGFDLVHAALEAVRNRFEARLDDWIVFCNNRYDCNRESWVPTDYYIDILFFLLSKMREDEQIEFLQKDIEGINYERRFFECDHVRSRVLEYLLNWPYPDNFIQTANLMWDFLPERNYAVLLLKICDKVAPGIRIINNYSVRMYDLVGPRKERNVNYGEEKIYDYRGLLKEFWHQSPDRFKRYVFKYHEVHGMIIGIKLLKKLLVSENFTNKDTKVIEFIFTCAKETEKENMLASMDWRDLCSQLLKEEKWTALDVLIINWFSTKEEADRFKREFIFTEAAQHICLYFVINDKWKSVDSALKWSSLPEKGMDKLKKALINSDYGRESCQDLITCDDKYDTFDKFVMWCFPFDEHIKAFKKEIIYSDRVMKKCAELAVNAASDVVDKFISCFLFSKEEIKKFKKDVAYRVGGDFCKNLISHYKCDMLQDEQEHKLGHSYKFQGGKWEEVEKFLTWCFPSEKEINEYKTKKIRVLTRIHHDLIKASQFEEAEKYFAWLGLSAKEIKELKKKDFFSTYMTDDTFRNLFYTFSFEKYNYFYDFGSDRDTIELLLRWYLADKETVLEFYGEFKHKYLVHKYEDEATVKDAFRKFHLAIAQRLSDLDEMKTGIKRKLCASSPSKRLCN